MSSPADLRLKQSFLLRYEKSVFRYGAKTAFFKWQDKRRQSKLPEVTKLTDYVYSRLRRGEAVSREEMIAFSTFLQETQFEPFALNTIAEAVAASEDKSERSPDPFRLSWIEHAKTTLLPLLPTIDAKWSMCHDERDYLLGAETVLKAIARQDGTGLTGDAALSYGERIMRRTKKDYATWLEMVASVNPNCVMFALDSRNGGFDRIGFSVQVPLKDAAYAKFRAGQMEDILLGKSDLAFRSKSVLIHALFECHDINLKERRRLRSRIQMQTAFAQLALVSEPILLSDTAMRLMSLAGTKQNIKRLRSAEFEPVGKTTPESDKPIVEFKYPTEGALAHPKKLMAYVAMKVLILCYQQALPVRDPLSERKS